MNNPASKGWIIHLWSKLTSSSLKGLRPLKHPHVGLRPPTTSVSLQGRRGHIIIDNVNNPQRITVNGPDRVFREEIHVPQQVTGYEYQFLACRDAIAEGLCEPPQMPLDETLYIMQLMDGLRKEWDVRYPMDED